MWSNNKRIVIVMLLSVAIGQLCWARTAQRTRRTSHRQNGRKPPTAIELLDKYAETQDKLKSFTSRDKTDQSAVVVQAGRRMEHKEYFKDEFRTDGTRKSLRSCVSYTKGPSAGPVDNDHLSCRSKLWDGNHYYSYTGQVNIGWGDDGGDDRVGLLARAYKGHDLMGYFTQDDMRVDSVLRRYCRNISVRERREPVKGSKCYVIDALTERGKYTLWIDPKHGYNIARAQVMRRGSDCDFIYHRLNRPVPGGSASDVSLKNLRFKNIDGLWVPMEAYVEYSFSSKDEGLYQSKKHYKRLEVILDPDHEALRSFYPDDIPSGTEVEGLDLAGSAPGRDGDDIEDAGEFTWQPGARFVVDKNCRVVRNDPNKNLLPIVKGLDVGALAKKYQLVPVPPTGKGGHVLLCFWDVDQEQSQQLMRTLADRQDELAKDAVSIIAIEASGVKTDELHSWAQTSVLSFPTGAFYAFFEKTDREKDDLLYLLKARRLRRETVSDLKMAWRIDKLPWLVLTDRDHVVTAEGFSLEELDEKIEENENVEQ
ncbi:MAG: hypothetical protein ACYTBJ_15750 [Planctomycetota bacterium]|jgi:hypothetical protein